MNITDPILLVILFLFGLRGFFRGLFRESFSLLGLTIGLMVAIRYDDPLAALWPWKLPPIVLKAITFAVLFSVVYFLFCLAGWLLHHYARHLFLGGFDRAGGVLLSLGKGTLVTALIIFFLVSSPFLSPETRRKIEDSYLGSPLLQLGQGLYRLGRAKLLPSQKAQAATEAILALPHRVSKHSLLSRLSPLMK